MTKQVLSAKCEALGLPFAPIARPSDLFDDPHLLASGGLLATDMTTARDDPAMPPHQAVAGLPTLPITFDEARVGLRRQPPRVGQHSIELAREAGLTDVQIDKLIELGVLTVPAQSIDRPPID